MQSIYLQTNKALRPEFFTAFGRFFSNRLPRPHVREPHHGTTDGEVSPRITCTENLMLRSSPAQRGAFTFRKNSLITKGSYNVLTLHVL